MKNLFGTDGVRGIYGEITPNMFFELGKALAVFASKKRNPIILLGTDTRLSRFTLASALKSGLTAFGAKVVDIHIVPTPVLAYLTKVGGFDYGVIITASHNPEQYNGIKIFNFLGQKISIQDELEITDIYYKKIDLPIMKLGEIQNKNELKFEYMDFLLKNFNFSLKNKNILLDCANGAMNKFAPNIYKKLQANVTVIDDGAEINNNCGVMHIDKIINEMKSQKYDIGFAFDGDGDRVYAVTKNLRIIDGDSMLYLFSKFILPKQNKVVGTIVSSFALEQSLKDIGVDLIRVDVGDKNVTSKLLEQNLILGAEKSGHIIISNYSQTGDGLIASLKLCELIFRDKIDISYELQNLKQYKIIEHNIPIKDHIKDIIVNDENFKNFYQDCNEFMAKINGRVVIRPSGTESVLRILIECENIKDANLMLEKIKNYLHNYI